MVAKRPPLHPTAALQTTRDFTRFSHTRVLVVAWRAAGHTPAFTGQPTRGAPYHFLPLMGRVVN